MEKGIHAAGAAASTSPATASVSARFPWRLFLPSLPLLVGLAILARAFTRRLALLYDPDTYMHIGAGRWIMDHWALPSHDPFSHTMPGAHWSVPSWLAEIVLATVFNLAGWGGLVVLTVACFAFTIAILTRYLLKHFEPLSALILVGASVSVTMPHLLARPHVLAMPLLVLWCGELFSAREAGRRPALWLLPLMVLWANIHGSFLFGLALAVFLAGEALIWPGSSGRTAEARRWGLFFFLALIATLLTPNGIAGLIEPIRLMNMPTLQTSFGEWQATNFQSFQPLELWLLGSLFVGYSFGFKLPLFRILLMLGLFHMALAHIRHWDLVGLVLPLAVAASLGPQIAAKVRSDPPSRLAQILGQLARPAPWRAVVAGLSLAFVICAATFLRPLPLLRANDEATPASALAAAERLGLSGPVFNSEGLGGYLIFMGVKTGIDGRIEMYGDEFLKNYLAAQSGNETAVTALLDRYKITWTLLNPANGVIAVLDHSTQWHRVYGDSFGIIFVRNAPLGSQG